MLPAAWLALALVLSLPFFSAASTVATSAAFLVEFLSEGRWRPLSAISPEPVVRPLAAAARGRAVPADLYTPPRLARPPALVLVHGLAPAGKDDSRLRQAARLLARSGWAVAVPTVDGLTALRLRPEDAGAVAATVFALREAGYPRVAILGISLGAGPALLAAAEPGLSTQISAVLALGGYASTVELLRYTLTGAYGFRGVTGRHATDEAAIGHFARANAELLDAAGRRLVQNRDPRALDGLVAELTPTTRRMLEDLSPESRLGRIRAPLFLVHGRQDPAVPFTESLRLAEAARAAGLAVRTTIVGVVGHVDPEERAGWADLLRLAATFYAFRLTAG